MASSRFSLKNRIMSPSKNLTKTKSDTNLFGLHQFLGNLEKRVAIFDKNVLEHNERMNLLVKRFDALERKLGLNDSEGLEAWLAERRTLRFQVAEQITAIVGLKEASTCRNQSLRYVWCLFLALGIAFTIYFVIATANEYNLNPTATYVALQSQSKYDFPPLLLCPHLWLDTQKLSTMNLTQRALHYSLGYFDYDDPEPPARNASEARREFFDFYDSGNFSTLAEYYEYLAVDLDEAPSMRSLANSSRTSSYFCESCVQGDRVRKILMECGVCYAFSLKPSKPGAGRRGKIVAIKHPSRSPYFALYFPLDMEVISQAVPPIVLQSQFRSVVKVSSATVTMLDQAKSGSECLESGSVSYNYSLEHCMSRCKNRQYKSVLPCNYLPLSTLGQRPPDAFCNAYDHMLDRNHSNMTYSEFVHSDEASELTSKEKCFSECRYPCMRRIFETSLYSEHRLGPTEFFGLGGNDSETNDRNNVSVVYVKVVHSAVFQGGTMALTEVRTYSFTSLINNVGGTLGLFVGGTLMTFVQIVMFCVDFLLTRRRQARVSHC